MECGERVSTRTSPCPTPRRRARVRRRGKLSPSVMVACTGSSTACSRISLEEMIHNPCASASVLLPPRAPDNLLALTNSQRTSSRCARWSLFYAFTRALADALHRALAGHGTSWRLNLVESVCSQTPRMSGPTSMPLVPCLTHSGGGIEGLLFDAVRRFVTICAQLVWFGALSMIASAALSVLTRWLAAVIKVEPFLLRGSSSMRNEVGVSVTTRHAEGAVKWRAADHPIRHAMRMAAWNAVPAT